MNVEKQKYWDERYQTQGDLGTVSTVGTTPRQFWQRAQGIYNRVHDWVGCEQKIVDYGCGVGRFVPFLCGHSASYVGLDIVDATLSSARRSYEGEGVRFRDVRSPCIEDRTKTLIWCHTVLQHIPEKEIEDDILPSWSRWLDKDGRIILVEAMRDEQAKHEHIWFRPMKWYIDLMRGFGFFCVDAPRFYAPVHTALLFRRNIYQEVST